MKENKMRKKFRDRVLNRDTIFVAAVLIISICLFLFTGQKKEEGSTPVMARVVQMEDHTNMIGLIRMGKQKVTARILSRDYQGQEITMVNNLIGYILIDRYVKVGDKALFMLDIENGKIQRAKLVDYDRQSWQLIMLVIFAGLLILFARYTGVKAFVSFIFTVVVLLKIVLPSVLKGYDPLFVCASAAILFGTVTLLLVGGFSIRAFAGIIGLIIGLILSTGLTVLFSESMDLRGMTCEYAVFLLQSGYGGIDLTRILIGSIILGSSGAMVDITIDVATAVREVAKANPALSAWRLIHSGFEVGRAALGTMVTTLLLAYFGVSIFLVLIFAAKDTSLTRFLNIQVVSHEILRTLAGSIGMVMIAPITAVIAGLLYHRAYGSPIKIATNPKTKQ